MRLTNKAIEAMTTRVKTRLALELNCSAYTVERWINDNENDGDLTKATAVKIISEETKLPLKKILEEVSIEAAK